MNRVILMLLLAVVSGSAAADLDEIGDNSKFVLYTDPARIHRVGDTVTIFEIYDFKSVRETAGIQYFSESLQMEFDCKKKKWRQIHSSVFSGHKLQGEMVHSEARTHEWNAVVADSVSEAMFKYGCGKK